MAASGHWPNSSAPVTAMLISALMFRLPLRMATQPFLKVLVPLARTATTANAAANPVGNPAHCTTSDAIAASPAMASGRHALTASGFGASGVGAPVAISGAKPSERTAARIGSKAWGSCVTVSTRCMRLNSMPSTPAKSPSFLRNNASSVGQSICMMRMGVCTLVPATAFLECASGTGIPTLAQCPLQHALAGCASLGVLSVPWAL